MNIQTRRSGLNIMNREQSIGERINPMFSCELYTHNTHISCKIDRDSKLAFLKSQYYTIERQHEWCIYRDKVLIFLENIFLQNGVEGKNK